MTGPEMVRVVVKDVPVALWQQTQEHSDELLREFMLISTDSDPTPGHDVPKRLLTLIDELTQRYAGVGEENERLLADAAEKGLPTIELVYELPVGIARDVVELGDLLDEADEFCRRGQHLLTLATPPDQVRFRRWFLDEMARQTSGEQPRPWPDYPKG
jgi:hypothetical protein